MESLRVRHDTDPEALCSAILGEVRRYSGTDVRAIGAGCIYIAVKALGEANRLLNLEGYQLTICPAFDQTYIDDEVERTLIRFIVRRRVLPEDEHYRFEPGWSRLGSVGPVRRPNIGLPSQCLREGRKFATFSSPAN